MAIDFILERYNYWIFVVLMMTGLYIVISRGNLVKKLIGLNLFQTSVFIYYISIGKIAGGTAPILIGAVGHGEEAADAAEAGAALAEGLHAPQGVEANDPGAIVGAAPQGGATGVEGLHGAPGANAPVISPPAAQAVPPAGFEAAGEAHDAIAGAASAHAGAAIHQTADIIYTNPLPHVLILTAIVVGIATTAVGLALAVRIREAYGTIEEDELEAADDIAEFGREMQRAGGSA